MASKHEGEGARSHDREAPPGAGRRSTARRRAPASPVGRLIQRLDDLVAAMEKANLAELVELYRNPARLMSLNFMAGVFRGFGLAVGFTAVGAIFLYLLGRLAALNIPYIGDFVAEIVRIVQTELARH
ncbi:DUF5665 domain-containing protein [Carboxydochorda subterranea]|uniref:DUF5665 domain-containing protein n=1 Tax=Carboxydichorda subterranea TaxID=3109565 RepID=A0ABZ1C0G7_9FIRM|nr:DUF5665 domain-containing protein [Limnochorda sp. L945t]WRP18378.1 DUF5665 domain-containing protein [Limnochorda sp. L945t]